jgi:tetratricopeptide (TPR) repeat protein
LYTTWDLSYRLLEKEDADAARLLKLLAYFDNQHIWFELMHAGIFNDYSEWLLAVVTEPSDFEGVMRVLADYCFIEVQLKTQSFSMHSCVHDWTLAGLNKNVDSWSYWYAFDCTANSICDEDWDTFGQIQYAQLALLAVRLTHSKFEGVGEVIPVDRIDEAEFISQLLRKQVQFEAAELAFQRVLAGNEKALGPDHTSTLRTVINLGCLYRDQGKLDEAEEMLVRALAGYEKALGPDHTSTLNTVNNFSDTVYNLGILYAEQDKLAQAEEMLVRVLAGREKALGRDHTSTFYTVNNLGVLYRDQGKLDMAEVMYRRVLNGFETCLGLDHPTT